MRNIWDENDVLELIQFFLGEEVVRTGKEKGNIFLNAKFLLMQCCVNVVTHNMDQNFDEVSFLRQIMTYSSETGFLYPPT